MRHPELVSVIETSRATYLARFTPLIFGIHEVFSQGRASGHVDGLVLAQPVECDQFVTRGLDDVLVVQHRPAFSINIADRQRGRQFFGFDLLRKFAGGLEADIGS